MQVQQQPKFDVAQENINLIKTLLVLTNPPTTIKRALDSDGFVIPPNFKPDEKVGAFHPKEIKKTFLKLRSVTDLFPNFADEEFANSFFKKVKKDNVTGHRHTSFVREDNMDTIENIQKKYRPQIQKLKDDIIANEKRKKEERRIRNIEKRQHIYTEVLTTERTYVYSLRLFLSAYVVPMKKFLPDSLYKQIHGAVDIILRINEPFLKQLERCFSSDGNKIIVENEGTGIPELFIQQGAVFKLYVQYVNQYGQIMRSVNDILDQNEKFKEFSNSVNSKLKSKGERATTIRSFLIMPVQRLPRYALLLNDLRKKYDQSDETYKTISKALGEVESVANYVNAKKREKENSFKVFELSRRYKLKDLLIPSRKLKKDGSITISDIPGEIYVFNDLIILIKKNKLIRIEAKDPDVRCNQNLESGEKFLIELARDQYWCVCDSRSIAVEYVNLINSILKENQKNLKSGLTGNYNDNVQREIWCGWLKKQGGGRKSKGFRKRWHIITGDNKMKYFDKKGGKFKGSYSLVGGVIGKTLKHKLGFYITTSKRTFVLKAKNEKEMEIWLEVLEKKSGLRRGEDK